MKQILFLLFLSYLWIDGFSQTLDVVSRTTPSSITAPVYATQALNTSYLSTMPNLSSYSVPSQSQLSCYPALNAVAHIFQQSPQVFGSGTSNSFRYAISTNQGQSFVASTAQTLNPLLTHASRYPTLHLFANGTSVNDLQLCYMSNILGTSVGQLQGLVSQNVATANNIVVTQEDYVFQNGIPYSVCHEICERVTGEFWALSSSLANERLFVQKGYHDTVLGRIVWTLHDSLSANYNTLFNGEIHMTNPMIAFSPDGTKGYISVLGDLVGGRDSIYQPIIWEYDAANDSWGSAYEVQINQFPGLAADLQLFIDPLTGNYYSDGTGTTAFNADLTVDANGNPHIFTITGVANSGVGTGEAYSIIPSLGMYLTDITKDALNGWSIINLSPQNTFEFYTGNTSPVHPFGSRPSVFVSRSNDGNFIFYHWNDADTTGLVLGLDLYPNLYGMMYDVQNHLVTSRVNWTGNDPQWNNRAYMPKNSALVFENTVSSVCGRSFKVPTTVASFQLPLNVLNPAECYYLDGIEYICDSAIYLPLRYGSSVSIDDTFIGINTFSAYPNPANTFLNVNMVLDNKDNVAISIVSINGQTLVSKSFDGVSSVNETLNLNGLASGMYLLKVSTSVGTATHKLIVE